MGVSKSEYFTERQNAIAKLAKAMAHPARVAIIDYLLKVDRCICGDIVNELPLAQPTISQHLRELKEAGLIKGVIEGTAICYCVNKAAFEALGAYFDSFSSETDSKSSGCCS